MNRTPLRPAVLFVVVSLLASLACGATGRAFPRTVVDGLGNEVHLETPPRRIFSTGLAMDNMVLTLVDPARVVGVTRFATDPAMGSYVADQVAPHMILVDALSPEYIVAADPDLVLVAVWNDPDSVEQVRRLGYPVYTFTDFNTVEDGLNNLLRLGELTGEEEAAAALVAEFRTRAGRISDLIADRPRPTVLYYNSWGSTVGSGTVLDDVIRYAGGINVVSAMGIEGWPQIDYELILQTNPEVIITDSGEAFVEQLKGDPLLASVAAVQSGKVYHIDHTDALDHRIILAIEQLAEVLHAEVLAGAAQ